MGEEANKNSYRVPLAVLVIVSVALGAMDFFIAHEDAHFDAELWPVFYGAFGFVSFVAIVVLAKYLLRPIVMRDEDYYE